MARSTVSSYPHGDGTLDRRSMQVRAPRTLSNLRDPDCPEARITCGSPRRAWSILLWRRRFVTDIPTEAVGQSLEDDAQQTLANSPAVIELICLQRRAAAISRAVVRSCPAGAMVWAAVAEQLPNEAFSAREGLNTTVDRIVADSKGHHVDAIRRRTRPLRWQWIPHLHACRWTAGRRGARQFRTSGRLLLGGPSGPTLPDGSSSRKAAIPMRVPKPRRDQTRARGPARLVVRDSDRVVAPSPK